MKFPRRALLTALGLAVLALLYFQALDLRRSADRRMGVVIDATGRPVLLEVTPGGPAAAAGLAAGDLLLSIAGRSLNDTLDYDEIAATFDPGQPVDVVVERSGERRVFTAQPGTAVDWGSFLLRAFVCLGYLALTLLALQQRPGDVRARLLALLALAVAVELAMPWEAIGSPALGIATTAFMLLLSGFQAATEVHLASLIPRRRGWLAGRPWIVIAYYAVGLGLGLLVCASYLAGVAGAPSLAWAVEPLDQVFNRIFIPAWALAVVGLLLLPALRWPEARGRQQAALVLLGVLPWAVLVAAGLAFDLLGRPEPAWVEDLLPVALLSYPIAVFAAIFRSHLFDLQLVVRRSAVYTSLTTLLILLFYGTVGVGGALLSQLVGESGSVWVVGVATLLLGLAFSPLRGFLQRTLSRRLFPEQAALRRRLIALAGELPAKVKLPAMGKHLVRAVQEIFAVRSAAILLAHPESGTLVGLAATASERMRPHDASLLLPIADPGVQQLVASARPLAVEQLDGRSDSLARQLTLADATLLAPALHHEELVGILLLGQKADGRHFAADELELLDLLCRHVAAVFENARLFESATDDSLTGLLRREAILERLEMELQRAVRYRRPLTIGMADLDRFKEVNDRYGHLVGDLLLQRMARALKAGLRGTDWVGRYGGEEFLLILPETDLAGGAAVAEKVRYRIEAAQFRTDDGEAVRSTISIGLASLWESNGGELTSATGLIAAADRALYRAKHGGRNRVELGRAAAG